MSVNYGNYPDLIAASGCPTSSQCNNWVKQQQLEGKSITVEGKAVDSGKLLVAYLTLPPQSQSSAASLTGRAALLPSSPISLPKNSIIPVSTPPSNQSSSATSFDSYKDLVDSLMQEGIDTTAQCWQEAQKRGLTVAGKKAEYIHISMAFPDRPSIAKTLLATSYAHSTSTPQSGIFAKLLQTPSASPVSLQQNSSVSVSTSSSTSFNSYKELIDSLMKEGIDTTAQCWQEAQKRGLTVAGKKAEYIHISMAFPDRPSVASSSLASTGSSVHKPISANSATTGAFSLEQHKTESAVAYSALRQPERREEVHSYEKLAEMSGCDDFIRCWGWAIEEQKLQGKRFMIGGNEMSLTGIKDFYHSRDAKISVLEPVQQPQVSSKVEAATTSFAPKAGPIAHAASTKIEPAIPQSEALSLSPSALQAKAIFTSADSRKEVVVFPVQFKDGAQESFKLLLIHDVSCDEGIAMIRNGVPTARYSILAESTKTPQFLLDYVSNLVPNDRGGLIVSQGAAIFNGKTAFQLNAPSQ